MWAYCIIPTASVTQQMLNCSAQRCHEHCRKSNDGLLTLLKFEVTDISQIPAAMKGQTLLTHAQAVALLAQSPAQWASQIPMEKQPIAEIVSVVPYSIVDISPSIEKPKHSWLGAAAIGAAVSAAAGAIAYLHFVQHWF